MWGIWVFGLGRQTHVGVWLRGGEIRIIHGFAKDAEAKNAMMRRMIFSQKALAIMSGSLRFEILVKKPGQAFYE